MGAGQIMKSPGKAVPEVFRNGVKYFDPPSSRRGAFPGQVAVAAGVVPGFNRIAGLIEVVHIVAATVGADGIHFHYHEVRITAGNLVQKVFG